ncbi:siderophore biosynthesis protein SbnG, partial [Staphylococcus cohnii]
TSDTVQSALRYMHDVTQGANKYFCALPRDTAQQQMWLLRGVNAFVLGDERGKLYRHLKSELAVHKGAHTT